MVDAADFAESWRICEGSVVQQRQQYRSAAEYDDDDNLNDSDDGGSQANSSDSRKKAEYKYPIKVGLKNGYQELVMRSPGRYELALSLMIVP